MKLYCFNRWALGDFIKGKGWKKEPANDSVVIQICGTKTCQKHIIGEKEFFYLPSGSRVLNLTFDDIAENVKEENGFRFYGISEKQARKVVKFIDENIGKNFYIACRAGHSRSQGIVRYILDVYGEHETREENPCLTPNSYVVAILKRAYRETALDIKNLIEESGFCITKWGKSLLRGRFYFKVADNETIYYYPKTDMAKYKNLKGNINTIIHEARGW